MEDKKVGHHFTLIQPGQEFAHYYPILMPFIEKVVEERKDKLYIYGYAPMSGIESQALKDFGITKEEWGNRIPVK